MNQQAILWDADRTPAEKTEESHRLAFNPAFGAVGQRLNHAFA